MSTGNNHIVFKKLSFITLTAVYFLILVGGVVRSTGSGMGCPDWPKCFGQWVPPTDVSELPETYLEDYAAYRHEKNVRFARYLSFFGMNDQADQITRDQSILVSEEFNVYKTWTEYANRLTGAVIGLLIFGMAAASVSYFKEDKPVFYLSTATLMLVGFQGWIGSIVVSTNLTGWIITIHMILALIIVLMLVYINFRIRKDPFGTSQRPNNKLLVILTIACLVTTGVQIVLGTQVRESVDVIAAGMAYAFRDVWIAKTGISFIIHRSFSLLILALHVWLLYAVLRSKQPSASLKSMGKFVVLLILLEIASGVIMAYFGIPPFIQPIHLLFSTLIFGLLYYMFLMTRISKKTVAVS